MLPRQILVLLGALSAAYAQQSAWGQCGGQGWSGQTTCVSGYTCTVSNPYYSQCLPGKGSPSPSTLRTTTTSVKPSSTVKTSSTSDCTSTKTIQTSKPAPTGPSSSSVKYLISFGDSYSQTGFDPTLQLANAANPLGNPTYPGWTTTGGANWIGFYATQFNSSPIYSYNFASGGATTDASLIKPYASTVLSLVQQVDQYEKSIDSISGFEKWDASNSLFAIWMGVNDVGNAWYLSNWSTLLGQIMTTYFNQVQRLYDSGARNFVFLSVPPIQYTPTVMGSGTASMEGEAAAVAQYNDALSAKAKAFQAANPSAKVWVVDTTESFTMPINNPTAYGAPNANCFDASGTSCLWFNDYHPGQAIQKLVAKNLASLVGSW